MSSFWDTVAGQSSGGASSSAGSGVLGGVCVSIPQEVKAIRAGNSGGWHDGATKGFDVAQRVSALSTETLEVGKTLRAAFSGKAADAAISRLDALGYALDMTAGTWDKNSRNVQSQADYFDHTQTSFVDVPDTPPDRELARLMLPWSSDLEAKVNEYDAKQQTNSDLYNAYANHGSSSRGSLSVDYGKLDAFNAGTISVVEPTGPSQPSKARTGTTGKHRAPDTADVPISHTITAPGGSMVPPVTGNSGGIPRDSGPGASGGDTPHGDDTTTAGFTPSTPGGVDPLMPPTSVGAGPGSGGSTATPSPYAVGGLGYLDAGGKTPAGSGTGAGVPGSGRQTGARSGGMVEEPGRTAPAGTSRAGGRAQGGPGGVGQAGRGAKEEDAEHRRKYVLDEDVLFDDKLIDPTTGLPAVPPTIGA